MRLSIVLLAAAATVALTAPAIATCELSASDAAKSPLHTRRPVLGDEVHITSGFGMRRHPLLAYMRLHAGVDWAAPTGTQVIAAGAGKVVEAKAKGEYGNAVLIDHGNGWQTLYAQLSRFDVKEGDCVTFGAFVGKVGSTGLSEGPHLHYEVRFNGQPVDPMTVEHKH
jgi:murein DD-endopeptidase MepM/ murein hydrolase activator NlpD